MKGGRVQGRSRRSCSAGEYVEPPQTSVVHVKARVPTKLLRLTMLEDVSATRTPVVALAYPTGFHALGGAISLTSPARQGTPDPYSPDRWTQKNSTLANRHADGGCRSWQAPASGY